MIERASKSAQKQIQNFPGSMIPMSEYWNEGYRCKLLKRQGNVALFQQFTDTGKPVAYEVIVIQTFRGKEHAPSNEDWGKLGWSFSLYENALNSFRKMTEAQEHT